MQRWMHPNILRSQAITPKTRLRLWQDTSLFSLSVLIEAKEFLDRAKFSTIPTIFGSRHQFVVYDIYLDNRFAESVEAAIDSVKWDRRAGGIVELLQAYIDGVVLVNCIIAD